MFKRWAEGSRGPAQSQSDQAEEIGRQTHDAPDFLLHDLRSQQEVRARLALLEAELSLINLADERGEEQKP